MKTVTVELGEQRRYPIYIGENLLGDPQWLTPFIRGKQVCIVTNTTVAPLYLSQVEDALAGYQVDVVVLPDGEQYKTTATIEEIYNCLLEKRHNRTTTIIALGGGVVGDMAGFAAATYQRGVDFIQIPTTLLSQVDSSVGGKTGVNHRLGKNMIGAFHQPNCVVIDTSVLDSLPQRELSAGLAEVIKYGLISDREFYDWLNDNLAALMEREPRVLSEAIERSCQNKAKVVAADEREGGVRAILNLGHTFGHAIEAAKGYGNWLHGEAVAAGMVLAAELSHIMGWLSSRDVDHLCELLKQAHLPTSPPIDMSPEQFLDIMSLDKKVIDGGLRLVLLESIGQALVTDKATPEQIRQAILAEFQ